jgi:hypothetical protein
MTVSDPRTMCTWASIQSLLQLRTITVSCLQKESPKPAVPWSDDGSDVAKGIGAWPISEIPVLLNVTRSRSSPNKHGRLFSTCGTGSHPCWGEHAGTISPDGLAEVHNRLKDPARTRVLRITYLEIDRSLT